MSTKLPDLDYKQTTSRTRPILTIKRANDYKNCLLDKLKEQRETKPNLCDMKIQVENVTFNVHKCLMIASCDYFDAMLRSGMQESRQNVIELKGGVSVCSFQTVVDFIYSGEIKLSMSTIGDLIRVISLLQVKYALKLCEEFLIDETNSENCIEMMHLADLFSIRNVRIAVNRFILRNFDKLIINDQYKKLTFEQMKFFLQSNKLKLSPEIKVFEAVVNWLQNYYSNSSDSLLSFELFQYVRFNTMKPKEFIDIVAREPLFKDDPKCAGLLHESYEYFALPSRQYCSSSSRSQIRNEPSMVCVNESMYILNRREDSWQYLCQSQATNKTLSQKFVVVNNFLYACGGYSETNRETCNKCHRFDPRTGLWYPIASMNEKRQFFTLASSNECIVAVGGVYGNIGNFYATFPVFSPIEVYSIEEDQWTSLKNCKGLPILKWPGAAIFSFENSLKKVFIVGGKLTEGPTHSLSQQSFIVDLKTSEIELCSPPITTRFNPSVFHVANNIILFAGEDEKYRLAPCIEIFDLKTRQWSEVSATIPVSLSYQCISSTSMVKSKIYYLLEEHDGPSSESYILKSAYFDINTFQFEEPVQLPHPSTLASKWCSLVFPQEFLERYQNLSNCNDNFDLRTVFATNCNLNNPDDNSNTSSTTPITSFITANNTNTLSNSLRNNNKSILKDSILTDETKVLVPSDLSILSIKSCLTSDDTLTSCCCSDDEQVLFQDENKTIAPVDSNSDLLISDTTLNNNNDNNDEEEKP